MTKSLWFAFLAATMATAPYAARAEGYVSHRIISTPAYSMPLPPSQNFHAYEIEVLHPGWVNSLFDNSGCESALAQRLEGALSFEVRADHSLKISWRGQKSIFLDHAYATYIPVHLNYGLSIAAHTILVLPTGQTLYIEISNQSLFGTRTATVSLVRSGAYRDEKKLVPIFRARGQ